MSDLADMQSPRPVWETLQKEVAKLRAAKSQLNAINFAIEAIRINLSCASFKDETILLEAMQGLEKDYGRPRDLRKTNS